MFGEIEFDQRGLAPCVVQDVATGEVLMLAYVSAESLEMTLETGDLHFHSRSRDETLEKRRNLRQLHAPAPAALRLRRRRRWWRWSTRPGPPATPASAAASTARCWARPRSARTRRPPRASRSRSPTKRSPPLERTLRSRAVERPDGSYTVELLDDPSLIGEKVEEEAEEVVRAGREETDERVAEEAADLLYHLGVLLLSRGVSQADVMEVLNARSG